MPANSLLYLASIENVDQYLLGKKFDVIIIDGDLDRYKCTVKSIELLNDNGAIVLDNSEGYWGDEGTYPILNLFRENKFCRIDFFGYAPGVIKPHCTSLFFRQSCSLLEGLENIRRDY